MSRVEIRGEQYPVGDIFGDKFAFFVPPYQRPYAWTVEHAGELLDDLLAFLGSTDEPVEELNPYFLGSIVLIKGDRPEAQIVDGQQRLITLTILLAALRQLVPEHYRRSVTRRLYEPADPLNNIPARYRIRPKERDAQFFRDYVQSEGGTVRLREQLQPGLSDSQRNMRENTLLFLRQLSALPERLHVRLAQFIVQRCFLVVVSTPDLSSAYRIFSVLNDRGLDLSSADILKAEIIGQIAEPEQAEYTARWETAEESLGRDAFNELIDHIRAIYQKARTRGTILEEFRQHVIRLFADSRRLIDEALVPYSANFYVINTASYSHAEAGDKINGLLHWLNRIDNSEWIAPAMSYLRRHHNDPIRLTRFLIDLERLATSMMLRRQYANKRITRYSQLLAAIEAGDDLWQLRSPLQLTAEEQEATVAALNGDIYLMQARPRQYLLLRLDSSLAGADAVYSRATITVEHVLPRNPAPGSEWMHLFPTFEDRTTLVHRLGNLVLLSRAKNLQASNYDFARKKRVYFAGRGGVSPFALTTQVLQEEEWTPQVVQRRQHELLAHLKQLWRL
jgi:uncharacterized protein with ParB-like and HNH nuclease domain